MRRPYTNARPHVVLFGPYREPRRRRRSQDANPHPRVVLFGPRTPAAGTLATDMQS